MRTLKTAFIVEDVVAIVSAVCYCKQTNTTL